MKKLLLEVKDITVHYYKVAAVRNISIAVENGKIATLIGSNGSGKTTILRSICGLKHPTTGEIRFRGQRIDQLSAHKINALGIAMVPEGRRVFSQMTVLENLLVGAYLRKNRDDVQKDMEEVVFKHFPRLKERTKQSAGTLSGGEQQMLAMGRALMSAPELLLLDEPSLGLSPIMCGEIGQIIRNIHAEGRTVVLVEQNARLALALAQQAYVIETGNITLSGPAEELRNSEDVKKAYLGG
ncbi:MAG: ABC transporter ATP-binding protein [Deltaproteobacteria bacterium]|nr:MAG: ABC transporter ATP-binding protein [Deltaproteobacteria bacterium]RLC17834.1 MAG: ABC transporter ATP-binding protein [Deltaproteobacteria bacterium]HHE73813.1 ABC transporter ATP-binding protein [Desulfobacteraceae bacterium]